jgi:hypothetical protein
VREGKIAKLIDVLEKKLKRRVQESVRRVR